MEKGLQSVTASDSSIKLTLHCDYCTEVRKVQWHDKSLCTDPYRIDFGYNDLIVSNATSLWKGNVEIGTYVHYLRMTLATNRLSRG